MAIAEMPEPAGLWSAPGATGEFQRGWRVLVASFVGIGVSTAGLVNYSAGIFMRPLEAAFGWTRAEIGASAILTTIAFILTAPFAGRLIDRMGLRLITPISLLLYAACIFALSRMQGSLVLYYAIVLTMTVVGICSTPLAFTRAVTAWFERNRGLALGLALTSTGVAAVMLPKFLTPFVEEHGWRAGYGLLGFIVLCATPLVWLWIRDAPLQTGVGPSDTRPSLQGATFLEARRDQTFWRLAAIFVLVALAVNGLIVSFIPLLEDAGLSATQAGSFGAVVGLSVMAGRLLTGIVIDRVFAPYVAATIFALVAVGFLLFALFGLPFTLVAAVALGFAMGAEVDLIGYFVARYFGLASYGQIYGAQYSIFVVGAGLSPMLAGFVHDVLGDYQVALLGASGLLMAASLLTVGLRRFPNLTPTPHLEPVK
jgi:sugar phosphate permease